MFTFTMVDESSLLLTSGGTEIVLIRTELSLWIKLRVSLARFSPQVWRNISGGCRTTGMVRVTHPWTHVVLRRILVVLGWYGLRLLLLLHDLCVVSLVPDLS